MRLFGYPYNDLVICKDSPDYLSFADDTRVYNNIKTVDDCNVLQSDLESVYNWADLNNMLFK